MTPTKPDSLLAELDRLMGYLRSDPDNADLMARAFQCASAIPDFERGFQLLSRMLAAKPGDPQLLYRQAQFAIRAGKLEEAESSLLAVQSHGVTAPEVSAALGHVYFLMGSFSRAREPLASAMTAPDRAPNMAPLYVRTLHQLGEIEAAITFSESWISDHPDDVSLFGVLSLLYVDRGDIEKAEQMSRRSLNAEGDNLEALIALGTAALNTQSIEEAEHCFNQALRQNAASGRAWLGRGLTEMLSLNLDSAERSLNACVERMPQHIGSWHTLAWCQILKQDYAGAERSFNKSLEIDDNFGESHGGLGVVAALQGDDAKAKRHIKLATRLDSASFSGRFAQSIVLEKGGRPDAAKKIVQALIGSVNPKGLATMLGRHANRRH